MRDAGGADARRAARRPGAGSGGSAGRGGPARRARRRASRSAGGRVAGGAASVIVSSFSSSWRIRVVLAVAGDDAAAIDDRDPVAELLGLLEIVRGQHDGDAAAVELAHVGPELAAQLDVDAGGGLVQDHHRRAVDQGLGDQQPPPHAAGQRAGIGVGLVGQADRRQHRVGPAPRGGTP